MIYFDYTLLYRGGVIMDNKNFYDADYEEVSNGKTKNIRGKVLYYSTSQVATMLEESDSKIRYYTKYFEDILNIETSNIQKQYTEKDIDKLKFIIDLKNEGMTLKQIKQYCEEVDFNNGEIVIKESNPLGIQALAQALMEEQTKQIEIMKDDILQELKSFMQEQSINNEVALDKIKEEICITVDEFNQSLDFKLEKHEKYIQNVVDQIELNQKNRDNEMIDRLHKSLENKQKNQIETKKKGWFFKIFKS